MRLKTLCSWGKNSGRMRIKESSVLGVDLLVRLSGKSNININSYRARLAATCLVCLHPTPRPTKCAQVS